MFAIPGHQIKGEKDDHDEKNPDRPEKAPPNGITMLLGIKKNPEGNGHRHEKKKKFQSTFLKKGGKDSTIQGTQRKGSKLAGKISCDFFQGPAIP
ncbi:MAG: hypothetical protein H6Q42_3722 [Deltaproteobacteria bacterium]|nr:hypothetical protein [Deltaproteobacteria bacterium]